MLSANRFARAGALCLRAARGPSAAGATRPVPQAVHAFHSGPPMTAQERKEEIEKLQKEPLFPPLARLSDQLDLGNWKRSVPLAVFLAIPAVQLEWLILSEETMIVGCFMLFAGAAYDLGKGTIHKMFTDRADAILKTHNELEDVQIDIVKTNLDNNKARLSHLEDVQTIYEARVYAEKRLAEAKTMAAKHSYRDETVKTLERLRQSKLKAAATLREAQIAAALESVTQQVGGDSQLKQAALDEALKVLADPKAASAVDPVSAVFASYWKTNAADMDKKKDEDIVRSADDIERLRAEAKVVYPFLTDEKLDSLIAETPKTYKLSDPSLVYA